MKHTAYAYAWERNGKLVTSDFKMLDHPPKGHVKLHTKKSGKDYQWPGQKLVRVKVTYEISSLA